MRKFKICFAAHTHTHTPPAHPEREITIFIQKLPFMIEEYK